MYIQLTCENTHMGFFLYGHKASYFRGSVLFTLSNCISSCFLFLVLMSSTISVCLYLHLFYSGFMLYVCHLYLVTYTNVQHDFHIRECPCRITLPRRVPLLEQELIISIATEFIRVVCMCVLVILVVKS